MKNFNCIYACLFIILFTTQSNADSEKEILSVDESIPGIELIEFPNENYIQPDKSDFTLVHSVIMSNLKGERWATITVKNNASGIRTFDQEQILALFADGTRRFPLSFEKRIQANTVLSLLVNFGSNQYPIIKIMTRQ